MSERAPVFRGTFAECLRHYAADLDHTYPVKRRVEGRRPLAQFTDAPDHSVYRWLSGRSTIDSERYLRTLYFLESQHYVVTELAALPTIIWQIGWLIAHRQLSLAEVLAAANYSSNSFFRLFRRGSSRLPVEKQAALEKLVERFPAIPSHRIEAAAPPAPVSPSPDDLEFLSREPRRTPKLTARSDTPSAQRDATILSHLIRAALPLAERMNSEDCTEVERQYLRQLTNDGFAASALFRLATALNGLCSQKAHELQREKR